LRGDGEECEREGIGRVDELDVARANLEPELALTTDRPFESYRNPPASARPAEAPEANLHRAA
jgi:hypothetical protein